MASLLTRALPAGKFDYWREINPSTSAALVFAIFFGASAVYHCIQVWKYRAWYFIAFTIGSLLMLLGYIVRYLSIKNPFELLPYVLQSVFIILPPSLYAATIYMLYGRIVTLTDATDLSIIRPTLITKVFVAGDAFAFLLQGGGGGMMTTQGKETLGKNILLIGLFLQLVSFGFFFVVSAAFYYRVKNSRRPPTPSYGKHHWTVIMKVLYVAAALIIFRCIFRAIEFTSATDAAIRKNEVYSYCFDAVPMLIVQVVFNFYHGGMVIPSGGVPPKGDRHARGDSQYELTNEEV